MSDNVTGHPTSLEFARMKLLEDRLHQNPYDFDALLEKGILLYEPFHQSDEAVSLLKFLIENDPKNVNALFWLAECLYDHIGDYESAQSALEAALRINPDRADCHTLLAAIMYGIGNDIDQIELHLKRAIELEPTWPSPQLFLASFLFEEKKFNQAKKVLENTLRDSMFNMQKPHDIILQHYEEFITGRCNSKKQQSVIDLLRKVNEAIEKDTCKN